MARYYDAGVGRFITRDTFHGFEDDSQSLNLYAYCKNNSINMIDPSGHISVYKSSDSLKITLSPTEVRVIITVGTIGIAVAGVVAALGGGSIVIVTGGWIFSISKAAVAGVVSASLGGLIGVWSIWWTGSPVTITIPYSIFRLNAGHMLVSGDGRSVSKYIRA